MQVVLIFLLNVACEAVTLLGVLDMCYSCNVIGLLFLFVCALLVMLICQYHISVS